MRPATPLDSSPWAKARWLVMAPHADDETLGAAALIAGAAADRRLAGVAFLTDGSGSRPCPTVAARTRLIRQRRREARRAVRLLAGKHRPGPIFLDWRDAHPYSAHSAEAARTERRLAALVVRLRVDAIATTALDEPHCDHAACGHLAMRVARRARRRVAVFSYAIWGTAGTAARTLRTPAVMLGRRRAALCAHASQLVGRHDGFRLPADKRRMAPTDLLQLVDRHVRT